MRADSRPARPGIPSRPLPPIAPGVVLCVIALHLLVLRQHPAAQTVWSETPARSLGTLQRLVDELKTGLAIPHAVAVSVVGSNRLVMSVAPPAAQDAPFQLSVDAGFLDDLTDDELSAAFAHELGHVWVFTHHPYLQTERLANEIAMRVVSRESLERVYSKMWAHGGRKGDLLAFLGPPAEPTLTTVSAGLSH